MQVTCTGDFCQLGCVCESLQCDETDLQQLHCGRTACMFKCVCNYRPTFLKKKITLPAGTVVATGTITRLQDEAVRNLARAEKEFTHTVVKAKDQTIVLGSDSDTKLRRQRRATKAPKKYQDYRDLCEPYGNEGVPVKQPETPPIIVKPAKPVLKKTLLPSVIKPCCIEVEKHDFSSIIPLCLVHKLYNCHCSYKATYRNGYGARGATEYAEALGLQEVPSETEKLNAALSDDSMSINNETGKPNSAEHVGKIARKPRKQKHDNLLPADAMEVTESKLLKLSSKIVAVRPGSDLASSGKKNLLKSSFKRKSSLVQEVQKLYGKNGNKKVRLIYINFV